MRVMPVGSDCEGYQYWYFYGTRLYREKCIDEFAEDMSEMSEYEVNSSNSKTATKKRRGRKRKIYAKTKSGRSVKPRIDPDNISRYYIFSILSSRLI